MTNKSDVVEIITLKPDAGLVQSLGAHHTLDSAIADLIDNCLDAEATRISVRLLTNDYRLAQVEVIDNGKGMDAAAADDAMTLGLRREYAENDLGHFGIGLKAASFGHCGVLTVWSCRYGGVPVGRRIRKANFSRDFSCERLSSEAATTAARHRQDAVGSTQGTTVVWSSLHGTYRGANESEARTWLANAEREVRGHLGVTFHRLIEKKLLEIDIVVDEVEFADGAVGVPVAAIDPLGYATTGRPGYPKVIHAKAEGAAVSLHCHIWPARTDVPGFRIKGKPGERYQGFFIYRNDRLLQIGGWSEAINPTLHRQLARVVIDDASAIGTLLRMNPEKSGLRFEANFREALAHAEAADGTTFDQFVEDAEATYGEANRRVSRRHAVIAPDRGFAPKLRRRIGAELPLKSATLSIQWKRMREGEFIEADVTHKTLWLNQQYRYLFAPSGSLNDAPMIKALLFLLTHDVFEGANLGPKDKDNINLWRSILGTAAAVEEEMRGG